MTPFKIYMIAGSSGKHQIIQYILGSSELNDSVWTLLHHPSLNFRTSWEQTCEIFKKHFMWHPEFKDEHLKFVTGHCLTHLRSANLSVAKSIVADASMRPVLDLRSFHKFCPFGHADGFAELQFRNAAWGYGPPFPDGKWCAALRWLSYYPNDVWPLFDIDCIEAMPHNRRFKIPIADLISDYDTWTVTGTDADYLQASLRYLHMAHLRLELRSRPWLPRWAKIFEHAHQKIEAHLPFLPDSEDQRQWQGVFLAMIKGEWTTKNLDELLPMLRRSSLSRSFQNRANLMFMAQCWCQTKVGQEARLHIQRLFAELLTDIATNPVYIARFLEQIVEFTAPYEFHEIVRTVYMNTKSITNHVHYTVWEILMRQKANPNRTEEFLRSIPLKIRQNVALKNLRSIEQSYKPVLWARTPLYLNQNLRPCFWSKDVDYIPTALSASNRRQIGLAIKYSGGEQLPKIGFGFEYADPLYSKTEYYQPKTHSEACHVLNAVLRHTLNEYDYRGGQYGYSYCYATVNSFSGEVCIEGLMDILMILFTWRCRVPSGLLPSKSDLYELYGKWDKVKLTKNWINLGQFRKVIVEGSSSSSS